jgi:hypothetical protein
VVKSGETRTDLSFSVPATGTVSVAGVVSFPNTPVGSVRLRLFPLDGSDMGTPFETAATLTDRDGTFTFLGVLPGRYRLEAQVQTAATPSRTRGPLVGVRVDGFMTTGILNPEGNLEPLALTHGTLWASQVVVVGSQDLTDLAVPLHTGFKVEGVARFEGSPARPTGARLSQVPIQIEATRGRDRPAGRGLFDGKDLFETERVPAGSYFLRVGRAPLGWELKGVMLHGRDISSEPFDLDRDLSDVAIVFTDKASEISGVVVDAASRHVPFSVLVFPDDSTRWSDYGLNPRDFRSSEVDSSGRFSVRGLPAGRYLVVSAPHHSGEWREAKVLSGLRNQAIVVSLQAGEQKRVDLVTRGRSLAPTPTKSVPFRQLALLDDQCHSAEEPISCADSERPTSPGEIDAPSQAVSLHDRVDLGETERMDAGGHQTLASGVISGFVSTGDSPRQPIRGAILRLRGPRLDAERIALSDDTGHFVFKGIVDGQYRLLAEKPGFVSAMYGTERSGRQGALISVVSNQPTTQIALALTRGAVITGQVLGSSGVGMNQIRVKTLKIETEGVLRRLVEVSGHSESQTDDRGVFRLYGLPAGDYVIQVVPPATLQADSFRPTTIARLGGGQGAKSPGNRALTPQTVAYKQQYHPGVSDPDLAEVVSLAPGQEAGPLSILLSPVATTRLIGSAMMPSQVVHKPVRIFFQAQGAKAFESSPITERSVIATADGRFSIPSIGPGRYTLVAATVAEVEVDGQKRRHTYWATADVSTDGASAPDVVLQLRPAPVVSGSINRSVLPMGDNWTKLLRVKLQPISSSHSASLPVSVQAAADGTFAFPGVLPGKYVVFPVVDQPLVRAITLKAVYQRGLELRDRVLEVRPDEDQTNLMVELTDRPSDLSGTVTDFNGQPAEELSVVVMPADERLWSIGEPWVRVSTTSLGTFRIGGLPAGEYLVVATVLDDGDDIRDLTLLRALASTARKIEIVDGQKAVITIRMQH